MRQFVSVRVGEKKKRKGDCQTETCEAVGEAFKDRRKRWKHALSQTEAERVGKPHSSIEMKVQSYL